MAEQTFEQAVRESRIFYRRELAKAITLAVVKRPAGGLSDFRNPAQFIEDLANAVTERLAAREEVELTKDPK